MQPIPFKVFDGGGRQEEKETWREVEAKDKKIILFYHVKISTTAELSHPTFMNDFYLYVTFWEQMNCQTSYIYICCLSSVLCVCHRRLTRWSPPTRSAASWFTTWPLTPSGWDRACPGGSLRPGECVLCAACTIILQIDGWMGMLYKKKSWLLAGNRKWIVVSHVQWFGFQLSKPNITLKNKQWIKKVSAETNKKLKWANRLQFELASIK